MTSRWTERLAMMLDIPLVHPSSCFVEITPFRGPLRKWHFTYVHIPSFGDQEECATSSIRERKPQRSHNPAFSLPQKLYKQISCYEIHWNTSEKPWLSSFRIEISSWLAQVVGASFPMAGAGKGGKGRGKGKDDKAIARIAFLGETMASPLELDLLRNCRFFWRYVGCIIGSKLKNVCCIICLG